MESGCGASSPSDSTNPTTAGEVSKLLANLPSRGLFSSSVVSTNQGSMRVYVCERDTTPPEDQYIRTNQKNILIRSLLLQNQKERGANHGVRKRAAEKTLEKASGKKAMTSTHLASSEEASSRVQDTDLSSLTVDRLRALLKEKGLPVRGKKDELISRLKLEG